MFIFKLFILGFFALSIFLGTLYIINNNEIVLLWKVLSVLFDFILTFIICLYCFHIWRKNEI